MMCGLSERRRQITSRTTKPRSEDFFFFFFFCATTIEKKKEKRKTITGIQLLQIALKFPPFSLCELLMRPKKRQKRRRDGREEAGEISAASPSDAIKP